MKNSKKLLVLIPALGLFLSGCSFQEVKHSIGESWVGQHILHPIYDPIKNLINGDKKEEQKSGEKEEQKEEEKKEEQKRTNNLPAAANEYTASLGSEILLPDFSGTATSVEFMEEYNCLDIAVGAGNEAAGVATYQADLLATGDFVEGEEDEYGDMHYISADGYYDVCPWDSTTNTTPIDGHVYVQLNPSFPNYEGKSFPLQFVNNYLNALPAYGFTLSKANGDAFSALASNFVSYLTYDSNDFPMYVVGFEGDISDQVIAVIEPIITEAGYEYDSDDGAYYNDYYYGVGVTVDEGYTFLVFA